MAELIRLQSVAAPNLPIAPTQYSPQHYDVLNNALRLYFNRLDQNLTALFSNLGGKYLNNPYISAYDSSPQYATGNNTPTVVTWSTGSVNGFTLAGTTATAQQSGVYKITFSLQFANTDNAIHDAVVWLRVNGNTSANDVVESATKFSIPARKSAGVPSYVCGYSEVVFELNTNDTVALWWATPTAYNPVGPVDGVYIIAEPAQTSPYPHPSIPSAIGSITFVSALQA
jgi:hypothetical protein